MTERWESGSEYHWPAFESAARPPDWPWSGRATLWGSGRDALRALLCQGRAERSWKRLLSPDYYCPDVLGALQETALPIRLYRDDPGLPLGADLAQIDLRPGDAVLVVNFMGLRAGPRQWEVPEGVELVEDHTHDPASAWARASTATFCVASLRKCLPAPDGGVLWSPQGQTLPPVRPVTPERSGASAQKLAAMVLKERYLRGSVASKATYRRISDRAEPGIASGPISGMPEWTRELLDTFPVGNWWRQRRRNHTRLARALEDLAGVRVLKPQDGATPFSAALVCDTPERRERLRTTLIEGQVYPAVLWPLEQAAGAGISAESLDLSRRMLSVHCDFRYGPDDMDRVAALVRKGAAGP